jgi:hypothetical protein
LFYLYDMRYTRDINSYDQLSNYDGDNDCNYAYDNDNGYNKIQKNVICIWVIVRAVKFVLSYISFYNILLNYRI